MGTVILQSCRNPDTPPITVVAGFSCLVEGTVGVIFSEKNAFVTDCTKQVFEFEFLLFNFAVNPLLFYPQKVIHSDLYRRKV